MWTKFDYKDFQEGLFWLLQVSPVFDCDLNAAGQMVGVDTGETKNDCILAWVETNGDGSPSFCAVDPANHGRIDEHGVITHFCEVISPLIAR